MSGVHRIVRAAGTLALVLSCMGSAAQARADAQAQAKAFDASVLLREIESTVGLSGGLEVRAAQATLREGESLTLTMELPRDGYLNVVAVDASGEPTVLFPNRLERDNKVRAGSFGLPTAQMPFELRAAAPFGQVRVAAFLTAEPLDLYANGDAGGSAARFARLSMIGRDLLAMFSSKDLQAGAKHGALAAGMVSVLTCAPTGPCEAPASGGSAGERIRRIADAVLPGIFLDKAGDLPQDKALALRPVGERGLALTKLSEGFVGRLYEDVAGYCTIAYGHLLRLGRCQQAQRARYPQGIAEPDGSALLLTDLALAQRAVAAYVKAPLNDGQYAALVDFTFNVGAGNFKRSTLLKAVNAGQHERVPFQLLRWTRAGGQELRGLRLRREREIALYFEGAVIPKDLPAGEITAPVDIRRGEVER